MKKWILFTGLLTIGLVAQISAQKFGHLNSQEIIQSFPEVKTADTQLEAYSKGLIDKGQKMMKDYETAYQTYASRANNGELSQVQMQQEESKLSAKLQELQAYEQEV